MNKKLLVIVGAVVVVGAIVALSLGGGNLFQGKIAKKESLISVSVSPTPVAQTVVKSTKNVKVASWDVTAKSDVSLRDLLFYGQGNVQQFNSVIGAVWLEIDGQNFGAKPVSSKAQVVYSNINYTIKAGEKKQITLWADVSSNSKTSDKFNFLLRNVKYDDANGTAYSQTYSLKSPEISIMSSGTLSIQLDSSTPNEDIVIGGTTEVPVSTFKATSTQEAYIIKKLTLTNRYDNTPGDTDNNIANVKISYTNSAGAIETKTGVLTNGKAYFSGLDILVPKDNYTKIKISVGLNYIIQGGGGATAGEMISIDMSPENFEAVALTSGETMKNPKFQGSASANFMHVYSGKPVFTLSYNSPSGSKIITPTDTVLAFNITNNGSKEITLKKLVIDLYSNGALDTTPAKLPQVTLKEDKKFVMDAASVEIKDSSNGKITFDGDLTISKGVTKYLELVVDTQSIITQSVNDDFLTLSIDYGSAVKGQVTPGDVTWENEGKLVQWLGNVGTTKLNSNTLKY